MGGDDIGVRLLGKLVKKSVATSKKATVLEHLAAGWMQLPEVSLARRAVLSGNLDEAVVEAEVVSDGVLPRRPSLAVVGELLDNVVTDFSQRQHLIGRLRYCHGDECDVRVGRFDIVLVADLRSGRSLLAISVHLLAVRGFAIALCRTGGTSVLITTLLLIEWGIGLVLCAMAILLVLLFLHFNALKNKIKER